MQDLVEQMVEEMRANAADGLVPVALAERVALRHMREAARVGRLSQVTQHRLSIAAQLMSKVNGVHAALSVADELIDAVSRQARLEVIDGEG